MEIVGSGRVARKNTVEKYHRLKSTCLRGEIAEEGRRFVGLSVVGAEWVGKEKTCQVQKRGDEYSRRGGIFSGFRKQWT